MKKLAFLALGLCLFCISSYISAQGIAINETGDTPHTSAMLDVYSTSKGLLIPTMTLAQRDAISSPATGLIIYQTDNDPGFYYNASEPGFPVWIRINAGPIVLSEIRDSDNDTRLKADEGDTIFMDTDGARRITVLPTGNVGIGSNEPSELLEVAGKVHAQDGFSAPHTSGDGVNVFKAGNPFTQRLSSEINGIEVAGAEANGLYVGWADNAGVRVKFGSYGVIVDTAAGDGVWVSNAYNNGLSIIYAMNCGVYVEEVSGIGVYVADALDEGFTVGVVGNPSSYIFSDTKSGFEVAGVDGNGYYSGRAEGNGVYINSAGDDGVYVYEAGNPSIHIASSDKNGFEVAGAQGNGLFVGQADMDGVCIDSAAGDGLAVFDAGDDGIYVNSAVDDGVYVNSADDDGVYVSTAGDDGIYVSTAGDDGVYVYEAGNASAQYPSSDKNGFEVAGAEDAGLNVGWANYGVYIYEAGVHGFCVDSPGADGVYVGAAGENGFRVNTAINDGFTVYYALQDGVDINNADYDGVYSNTLDAAQEWGLYTPDKINAANITSKGNSTYARNTGSKTLEAGDIVCIAGGLEENVLDGDGYPVVNIEKANNLNSQAVFGVVEYKVTICDKKKVGQDGASLETRKRFKYADGDIYSGDYLSVIVFGQAEVKVDNQEPVSAGDGLVADNGNVRKVKTTEINGITIAENTGILGKALENSSGKGKVRVFVNCK